VNQLRVGRSFRAIRRSQGVRQVDVAQVAGCSQGLVSAIERGHCAAISLAALGRVFAALGADVDVIVRYRGADLDRLLDERHAAAAMAVLPLLRKHGWGVISEVTFNHYGDRGSIDLLAFHPPTRTALVVEVKTELVSAEETLRRLDVKVRIAPSLVPDRVGERAARVVGLLAVVDSTANRSRVARLAPLLETAFPLRSAELRHWLRAPGPAIGGLLFVRNTSPGIRTRGSRRVRRPATALGTPGVRGGRQRGAEDARAGRPPGTYQHPG
jgi:transcriptional regulator with XRE-family HTH domain